MKYLKKKKNLKISGNTGQSETGTNAEHQFRWWLLKVDF